MRRTLHVMMIVVGAAVLVAAGLGTALLIIVNTL